MSTGERVRERMGALQISQAELARRVGVAQPTIHKLVHDQTYSSRHLVKVARELRTTPAYLMGESDAPDADAPGSSPLSMRERALLDHFGAVPERQRAALAMLAGALASAGSVASAARLPGEDELAVVFEALLDGIDPSLPLAERARLLAQRLPIGLSQLQGVVRDPAGPPATPAPAGSPRALATHDHGSRR